MDKKTVLNHLCLFIGWDIHYICVKPLQKKENHIHKDYTVTVNAYPY